MKYIRPASLLLAAFLLGACSQELIFAPLDTVNFRSEYRLISLNGQALPAQVDGSNTISSGKVNRTDGSHIQTTLAGFNTSSHTPVSLTATYVAAATGVPGRVELSQNGTVTAVMNVSGDTVRIASTASASNVSVFVP